MFYLRMAARFGGPVLELGCGNGRITLPLARAEHEITGLDLCEPMLDDLRSRLASEPSAVRDRVTVRRQDFLDLDGERGRRSSRGYLDESVATDEDGASARPLADDADLARLEDRLYSLRGSRDLAASAIAFRPGSGTSQR